MNQSIKVTKTNEGLLVEGLDQFNSQDQWQAMPLETSRLLLQSGPSANNGTPPHSLGKCSCDMLCDVLLGINYREWSGRVVIEAEGVKKSLFFKAGEFVFATSDLIDDRLGEVIYRNEMISLDQLTSFAVKVDRKNKFGQVLLRSGEFNSLDLWRALKSQAIEILGSVFLPETCYLEVHDGSPPLALSFQQGTRELIESSYLNGTNFRVFKSRLQPKTSLSIKNQASHSKDSSGKFFSDILEMCKDNPTWEVFLGRSKLSPANTISAVMKLAANGQIQVNGLLPIQKPQIDLTQSSLDKRIESYGILLASIRIAFQKSTLPFPITDLQSFSLTLNESGNAAFLIGDDGDLTPDSVINIYQQCLANRSRIEFFQHQIDALTRFLTQVAGDLLPPEAMKVVKTTMGN